MNINDALNNDDFLRSMYPPIPLSGLLARTIAGKVHDRYVFERGARVHREDLRQLPHDVDWIRESVHRICDLACVPRVTAHALRGLLATLTAQRGLAGHLIAATLGHSDERVTMGSYVAPGAAAEGVNRRGLVVLNGGVQAPAKVAK